MSTKDLKVKMPKKFKKDLEARFNYKNADGIEPDFIIVDIECPLCHYYDRDCINENGEMCPFAKGYRKPRCLEWVKKS